MQINRVPLGSAYEPGKLDASELLEGEHSNVRLIRLSPGVALPPHDHAASDLMLFVVEGEATIETATGPERFEAGALACFDIGEELRVTNDSDFGVTLLAFLAPKFPPR